ncbi:flavodoxin family protein [Bizionia sediminis]|uniref:Flavodoxin family protein n=1 Tax=Bizionia sediminis TaxID=1737064 RepID=A0ABW5KRQ5_9FLAO
MDNKPNFTNLNALFINCTLKKSPSKSHTETLINLSKSIMIKEGVQVENLRFIDFDVASGIYPDMTNHGWDTDAWPAIYKKVMAADILVIGTPIWLGEKSSEAQKLIERLYAMSGKTNAKGQYVYYGKVGGCIITGNEDGAKHCAMGLLYALQHIGYSIPPQADSGWLGAIGPGPSYGDTEWQQESLNPPAGFDSEFTNRNVTFMTYNLLHLAGMLKLQNGYPKYGNSKTDWTDGKRWHFENPEYR